MRTLTYFVAVSLDGFVCAPDGSFDFFPSGSEYDENTAFHLNEYPELVPTSVRARLGLNAPNEHFDTMLQGRGSYQVALDQAVTSPYGHMREYVFSRTLPADIDPNVTVVATDPRTKVRELKAQESELDVCLVGGPTLAGTLLPEIDELLIKRYPVIVGAGKPLFAGATFDPTLFARVKSDVYANGSDYTLFRRHESSSV